MLLRQSARFRAAEAEHTDDSSGITKDTMAEDPFQEQFSTSKSALAKDEGDTKGSTTCVARPSRAAAKKVQSYKEVPVKVKMRRPD